MRCSKTELQTLSRLAKGMKTLPAIARDLRRSISQQYRIAQQLRKKDILTFTEGILEPERKTHVTLLLQLLGKAPALATPLSGTGLHIFVAMLEPKTITELQRTTGLHKTTIFKKINEGRKLSLVRKQQHTYHINERIWPDAKAFLLALKDYEEYLDPRVPISAIIYAKNEQDIVFSTVEDMPATKTAFSAYEHHGIPLLLPTHYYTLPQRPLTTTEVFQHSLVVAEKDPDPRHLTFIALFAMKYHLLKDPHHIVRNLERIHNGERIAGYPTWEEIKDRARVYDIPVQP